MTGDRINTWGELIGQLKARIRRLDGELPADRALEELLVLEQIWHSLPGETVDLQGIPLLRRHLQDERERSMEGRDRRAGRDESEPELVAVAYARHLTCGSTAPKVIGAARARAEADLELPPLTIAKAEKKFRRPSRRQKHRADEPDLPVRRLAGDVEERIGRTAQLFDDAASQGADMKLFAREFLRG